MQNKEKVIKFREYVESVKEVSFCDIEALDFQAADCSIAVYKKLKDCKQSIEDFLIQFLLKRSYDPQPCIIRSYGPPRELNPGAETKYSSQEIVSVDEERMTPLPKMLLNTTTGGEDIFIMRPMNSKDIDEFQSNWLIGSALCRELEDDIKKFGFDIEKLTNRYLLSETASSMDILIYAEDEEYVYLSGGHMG